MDQSKGLPELVNDSRNIVQQTIENGGYTMWSYLHIVPENMLGILAVKDDSLTLLYLTNDNVFSPQQEFTAVPVSEVRMTVNEENNIAIIQHNKTFTEGVLFDTFHTFADGQMEPGEKPTKWTKFALDNAIQNAEQNVPSALGGKKEKLEIVFWLIVVLVVVYSYIFN